MYQENNLLYVAIMYFNLSLYSVSLCEKPQYEYYYFF